jgi:hypothetical protein
VDDGGPGGGLGLCVVDSVEVELAGPAVAGDRERAEVGTVGCHGRDVLQDLGVVDAVVGVDAESDAGGELER